MRIQRFIPAHAGNAFRPAASFLFVPVHPRARGERRRKARNLIEQAGSSPRTRGTHIENIETVKMSRFIPAHAGNAGKPLTP